MPDCQKPDIVVKAGVPYCHACKCAPDVDAIVTEQSRLSSVPSIPPDEPLEKLRLRWPSTVEYTTYGDDNPDASGHAADASPGTENLQEKRTSTVYTEVLDDTRFRLLYLNPSSDKDAPIHADLEVYSFDACPEYEAVSYTWGGETDDTIRSSPVYIGAFWDVVLQTRNCAAMLRYARRSRSIRTLWIDAFCIDQSDMTEKGLQIPQMPSIYRGCARVLAYLGEEIVGRGSSELSPRRSFEMFVEIEQARRFINCRYFTRVWIIQELVLARQVLFPFQGVEYWVDRATISWLKSPEELWLIYPDDKLQWLREHLSQQSFQSDDISTAMQKAWTSKSADIRDKLFGILGLVKNISAEGLTPDYNISALQMFTGLSAHFISNLGPEFRYDAFRSSTGIRGWGKQPSWVPDWLAIDRWPLAKRTPLREAPFDPERLVVYASNVLQPQITIGGNGSLSLDVFYICPIRQQLESTTKSHRLEQTLHQFRLPFGDQYFLILASRMDALDSLINTQMDHLVCFGAGAWIVRKSEQSRSDYRVVACIEYVLLEPNLRVIWDATSCYIEEFLVANAVCAIHNEPPSMAANGVLSDPYLERLHPDLCQRRKTNAAKIFMRQAFPGEQDAFSLLKVLCARGLPTARARLQYNEMDIEKLAGRDMGRVFPLSTHELFWVFYAVNKGFTSYPWKLFGPSLSATISEFIKLFWYRDRFSDVEARYFSPLSTAEEALQAREEQNGFALQPLVWEWSVHEADDASYVKVDRSDAQALRRFRDAIVGHTGVSLRTRTSELLSRLQYYYQWDEEVLKRLSPMCTLAVVYSRRGDKSLDILPTHLDFLMMFLRGTRTNIHFNELERLIDVDLLDLRKNPIISHWPFPGTAGDPQCGSGFQRVKIG